MNVKKSISILSERILSKTEAEAKEELLIVLNSFEMQIRYGALDKTTAFANSIYTPTTKKNEEKEISIEEQKKRVRSAKYRTFLKHEDSIIEMRDNRVTLDGIAKYLNSFKVHKRKYFTESTMCRYCQHRGIEAPEEESIELK